MRDGQVEITMTEMLGRRVAYIPSIEPYGRPRGGHELYQGVAGSSCSGQSFRCELFLPVAPR